MTLTNFFYKKLMKNWNIAKWFYTEVFFLHEKLIDCLYLLFSFSFSVSLERKKDIKSCFFPSKLQHTYWLFFLILKDIKNCTFCFLFHFRQKVMVSINKLVNTSIKFWSHFFQFSNHKKTFFQPDWNIFLVWSNSPW